MFSITCENEQNGYIIAVTIRTRSPPHVDHAKAKGMFIGTWIAIFSYSASLVVSLAIWRGLFRAVEQLNEVGAGSQAVRICDAAPG